MVKFVFWSLLFIPTELVVGDILQDENFHPEANLLLSPAEFRGFLFTIQNWLFFRESFGLLISQILLQHFGLRSWRWPYPQYPDIFCHSQWHSKDWKLSCLSTTNSKIFAVEFSLEWVFLLPWKNGVKDAKVYLSCVARQYKPIPYHIRPCKKRCGK